MNRLIKFATIAIIILFLSCAPHKAYQVNKKDEDVDVGSVLEQYGVDYTVPNTFSLLDISSLDDGETYEIVYIENQLKGHFFIRLYRNYCHLNDIDPNYVWGYLKGCVSSQMNPMVDSKDFIIQKSHHVYASQAIYFKKGSFISPTIVFDKKITFKISDKLSKFKSLGYAYKYKESYYLIEVGYITNELNYESDSSLFSNILRGS